MSETGTTALPEQMAPEPPKKHGRSRLIDPLLASVPPLIGTLVGALIGHLAEVQHINFEREDSFRRDQIKRVASVAHGYDELHKALVPAIAGLQERLPGICARMPAAAGMERVMLGAGLLRTPFFSAKPGSAGEGFKTELAAVTSSATPYAAPARALKAQYTSYSEMADAIVKGQKTFVDRWDALQATLVFEVNVYFPPGIRADVRRTLSEYYAVEKDTLRGADPASACGVKPDALGKHLAAIHFRSSREMIQFAQSLEPEIVNRTVQR